MRKPKVGQYIRMISYGHHYEFEGKVAKVVDNPDGFRNNITLDFGEPISTEEGRETHFAGEFENPHYLYLTDLMQYEILVQDNVLNRLLYPDLKPSGKGYLI